MHIIKSIITKPLLTSLYIIAALGLSYLFILFESQHNYLLSLGFAIIIMTASVLYSIWLKNWGKLFFYLLMHVVIIVIYFIGLLGFAAAGGGPGPKVINGDNEFYYYLFERHTAMNTTNLDIYCKQDTIYGIGPFGQDFSAISIFKVDENQVEEIENEFRNNTTIIKSSASTDSEIQYAIENSTDVECGHDILYEDYGYTSMIGDDLRAYFILSKDKDYLLFYVRYS